MAGSGSHLDFRDRDAQLRGLEAHCFDLLVIGGGITGAGIARDAAMRGLTVALIEARDFASGTSSRSSKMIHGGLRYLANAEFGLVREAASERQRIRRIAPHLAQPCWYVLPSTSAGSTLKLRAALSLFDRLGDAASADRHWVAKPAALRDFEPAMRTEGLHRGLVYREYLTDDARLTLANVRDAAAHGAAIASYLAAGSIAAEVGGISSIVCRSTLPGADNECRIRARAVVNAAGPWVDAVRQAEQSSAERRLALSKGIHLVVPQAALPVRNTVIINTPDKRMVFAVPRGAFTYIGTTDEFYPDCDYWPRVERDDVDYLLTATRRALFADNLSRRDIVSIWSGVRPLVGQQGKSAKEVSRKDEVWTGPTGMLSIAGGKLSAYRAMAERIVDTVVERLGIAARPCATTDQPLPGGDRAACETAGLSALDPVARERLMRLYGSEAEALASDGGDIAAEARRAVLCEGALRLEDYWVRRSGRAWFDDGAGMAALAPAAHEMAALLGWNEATIKTEIEACQAIDRDSKASIQAV